MTYVVPAVNWTDALAEICRKAQPGDVIHVNTTAKAELAKRALDRLNISGVQITTALPPVQPAPTDEPKQKGGS
jgi:hypothetical protein